MHEESSPKREAAKMASNFDYLLKIVIIGDQSVGKSSILVRYADNVFSDQSISTIGVDFKIKTLTLQGKTVKLQIWDTAGQEKFRNITTSYYRGAHGIIVVCDVTNQRSFDNLAGWIDEIAKHVNEKELQMLLIGNKVDMEDSRVITTEMLEEFANKYDMPYIETSAKAGNNVEEVFNKMANEIISKSMSGKNLNPGKSKTTLNIGKAESVNSNSGGGCCG